MKHVLVRDGVVFMALMVAVWIVFCSRTRIQRFGQDPHVPKTETCSSLYPDRIA